MIERQRDALRAYEEIRNRLERDGWKIRQPRPDEPYDFVASKGEELELGVETTFAKGTTRKCVSQTQYPADNSWAWGILWKPDEHSREELLLIPSSAWNAPQAPLSAPENGGSRWGPTFCVAFSPRHQQALRRYSLDSTKLPTMGMNPAEDQRLMDLVAKFVHARADRPEERELRAPAFFPEAVLKPGRPKKPLGRRLNAVLLEQFLKKCREKGLNGVAAIEAYMAYEVGVDCPDSPYLTDEIKAELEKRRQRGDRLPSYWTDRSIRGDLPKQTKAKPSTKKR